jgi:urease accessory protein
MPAVRITRDDLLTPPEFGLLRPVDHPAARVGGARIELIRARGATRLGRCYQQVPVRLVPPFTFDAEPAALLYLINPTAGLMDGDGHCIDLVARSGASALVTGQSATRVHPAVSSFATQQWNVAVEADASLVVLPGPLIPFRGSRYYQRGRVSLEEGARLIWGDIWLPGRYQRGAYSERFEFDRIIQDFEVRRAGELVYRERFDWRGPWSPDEACWRLGANLCCAALFVAGSIPDGVLRAAGGFDRSVFALDAGDACIRWCGPPEEVAADVVHTALLTAASWSADCNARPWFLRSGSLAPNHWFMPIADQPSVRDEPRRSNDNRCVAMSSKVLTGVLHPAFEPTIPRTSAVC